MATTATVTIAISTTMPEKNVKYVDYSCWLIQDVEPWRFRSVQFITTQTIT